MNVKTRVLPLEPATTLVGETVMVPWPLVAAAAVVTVGLVAMVVRVPPEPDFVCVVKVETPGPDGAATPEKVSKKVSLLAQVWVMVITEPATVRAGVQEVPVPLATAVLVVRGVVQPEGTVTVVLEPAGKTWPEGAAKVKTSVLPVELVTTVVGETVMVPAPLAAVV